MARGLVLGIVLIAASSMAERIAAEPTTALSVVGVSLVLHLAALAAADFLSRRFALPDAARTAVLFAGSQKTLFVGVFLAREYFPDEPPTRSAVVSELLVDVRVEVEVVAYRPLEA